MQSQIIIYGIGAVLKLPIIFLVKKSLDSWEVVTFYNAIVLFVFCAVEIGILDKMINNWIHSDDLDNE